MQDAPVWKISRIKDRRATVVTMVDPRRDSRFASVLRNYPRFGESAWKSLGK